MSLPINKNAERANREVGEATAETPYFVSLSLYLTRFLSYSHGIGFAEA